MATFWGLKLSSGLRYTKLVKQAFHISAASIDPTKSTEDEVTSVLYEADGQEHILCNLSVEHSILQVPLDLQFSEGNIINFFLRGGKADVHLTGYNVFELSDFDESDLEDAQSEDEEIPQLVQVKRKRDKSIDVDEKSPKVAAKKIKVRSKSPSTDSEPLNNGSPKKKGKASTPKQKESTNGQKKKSSNWISALNEKELNDDTEDEDFEEEETEGDEDASDEEMDHEEDEEEEVEDEDEEVEDEESDDDQEEEEEETMKSPVKVSKPIVTPSSAGRTPMVKSNTKVKDLKSTESPMNSPKLKTPKPNGDNSFNSFSKADKENSHDISKSAKKKKNKDHEKTPKQAVKQDLSTPQSASKKILKAGGVVCEDLRIGTGADAKNGRMLSVYYEGKLKNGKIFDKTLSGPCFKFRLGNNEVIKAWEVGLEGMKVGGKRKITAPPNMAYGAKGALPEVPPNSMLVFEVELKAIH